MALQDLLALSRNKQVKKIGLSEERLKAAIPVARKYISFWREYPDLFVDFLLGEDNPTNFKFYTYQRIFLRSVMRHKYAYAVYPRAYSKSFLAVLVLILRCILYPGIKLFVTTGGKEQAADITKAKVHELCELIPALNKEIDWRPGKTRELKDKVIYVFFNGSTLDILAARESSRGQRRIGGLIEEAILVDQTILQEVIVPTMNVDRRLPDGSRDEHEVTNKSQCYVTTAGFKNTFAYLKLIQVMIQSIIMPEKAIILGGTYKVPVYEKLLPASFIKDLKLDGTFNESSFDREYRSIWGGDAENAFFSAEVFDKHRKLLQPEKEASGRIGKSAYYIIGVDVGRKGLKCIALLKSL